jgi:hypothetical protein
LFLSFLSPHDGKHVIRTTKYVKVYKDFALDFFSILSVIYALLRLKRAKKSQRKELHIFLYSDLCFHSMSTNIVDEDENYTFEILQAHHLTDCAALLADSFTKQNPMNLYLHTTYDQFYPIALSRSDCILKDRLSVVAIHKLTKELHGCIQASDAKTLKEHHPILPAEHAADLEVLKPVNDLLEELEDRYFSEYAKMNGGELKERCILQMLLGATRVGCEGHGK